MWVRSGPAIRKGGVELRLPRILGSRLASQLTARKGYPVLPRCLAVCPDPDMRI